MGPLLYQMHSPYLIYFIIYHKDLLVAHTTSITSFLHWDKLEFFKDEQVNKDVIALYIQLQELTILTNFWSLNTPTTTLVSDQRRANLILDLRVGVTLSKHGYFHSDCYVYGKFIDERHIFSAWNTLCGTKEI